MRFLKVSIVLVFCLSGSFLFHDTNGQMTFLDIPILRSMRILLLDSIRLLVNNPRNAIIKGKVQDEYPETQPFFCDAKNGPGKRSIKRPTSIHQLTPGDIDIITSMGDSLTAGNGLLGTESLHILIEYRAVSWTIGGKKTWRQYVTLPNILKEFNPKLYGYSIKDGFSTEHGIKFNVAEAAAVVRDMPYQAKVLYQRLKADKNVNMLEDWKLLSLQIGANDICSEICLYQNPYEFVQIYENHMLKTLRYLRDHIPKLMINIIPTVNVSLLLDLDNLPTVCSFSHIFECPCLRMKYKNLHRIYFDVHQAIIKKDAEIANRNEFNTNEFTINIQPFSKHAVIPKLKNGTPDYRYFSYDCFHFSQRLHAKAAMQLFNNMLEPENTKYESLEVNVKLKCPTINKPYLATRVNSKIL